MGCIIHSFVLLKKKKERKRKINKRVNYKKKYIYGWIKSRVSRLILSKENFVAFVDMFSLSEVCILLSEKPMFLIAQPHYSL